MTSPVVSSRFTSPRWSCSAGLLGVAWIVASLEGYDLAVYGVSIPAILSDHSLGINKAQAGTVGSLVGVGMLIGAAFAGATVHRFGQRMLLLTSTVVFSVGMAGCAAAGNATTFGFGRLVVGLGLGVVLPTLNAYVADLSEPGRRSRHITIMMSGYAAGALVAPLLGAALLPGTSYRWLYVVGVVPVLFALPMLARLPESPFHLSRTGRPEQAGEIRRRYGLESRYENDTANPDRWFGVGPLLRKPWAVSTVLFWIMSFCGLLLVFGISAWLPTIMQAAGYSLGSALLQTGAMWLGVGVGVLIGGQAADRFGAQRVVVFAFLVGTVSLVLMSLRPPTAILFILMFISGFGFIGSQIIGNAFIVTKYSDALRSNGLAWALSVGRVGAIVGPTLGAAVLGSGAAVQWNFYAFAIVGAFGAVTASLVPRKQREAA